MADVKTYNNKQQPLSKKADTPTKKIKIGSKDYEYSSFTIDSLMDLLKEYDYIPKMFVDSSISGEGEYNYGKNEIKIHPQAGNYATIGHELTHASDNLMGMENYRLSNKGDKSKEDMMFMDAYTKLNPATSNIPRPTPKNQYEQYRYSPKEMRAFGVGNYAGSEGMSPGAPHVDATMAQEYDVLADLFRRRKKK